MTSGDIPAAGGQPGPGPSAQGGQRKQAGAAPIAARSEFPPGCNMELLRADRTTSLTLRSASSIATRE
eukprot:6306812-Pyramimonas_sp.AAC.1